MGSKLFRGLKVLININFVIGLFQSIFIIFHGFWHTGVIYSVSYIKDDEGRAMKKQRRVL